MHLDKCTSIRSNQQQQQHTHAHHNIIPNHRYTPAHSDKWYALTPIVLFSAAAGAAYIAWRVRFSSWNHNFSTRPAPMLSLPSPHTLSMEFHFYALETKKRTISCKWTHLWSSMENKYVAGAFHSIQFNSFQFNSWFCCGCTVHVWSFEEESLNVVPNKTIRIDSCVYKSIGNNIVVVIVVVVFYPFRFISTALWKRVFTPHWAIHFTWNSKTSLPKDACIKSD